MLFKSLVRLMLINLLFSFLGMYFTINYKIREAERIARYEVIREIASVSLVNRLYHPACDSGVPIDIINDTLPICDPGYVCKKGQCGTLEFYVGFPIPRVCEHHISSSTANNNSFPFPPDKRAYDMRRLEKWYPSVRDGGAWAPCDCLSPTRMAIIVPFRDRDEHFRILLNNLIAFLQRQKRAFRIFLIEQGGDELFNRAAVSNAGFIEANKLGHFDCFIFHDVDLLPIDLCNVYTCGPQPRHLAVGMNKFRYRMPYRTYCGGVLSMHRDTVKQLNGFTNVMFGWGGEDDDIYARIRRHNLTVDRYPISIAKYDMIKHKRDETNPASSRSMRDAGSHWKYSKFDGLNSANYNVTAFELHDLYTRIEVRFSGGPKSKDEGIRFFKEKVRGLRKQLTADPEERRLILDVIRQLRKEKAILKRNSVLKDKLLDWRKKLKERR